MEWFNKKLIILTIIICILVFNGCDKIRLDSYNASKKDTGSNVELSQDKKQNDIENKDKKEEDTNETKNDIITTDITTPTPSEIQPIANTELMIYTINVDTGEIETAISLIPSNNEITPELIVETVIESMADQSLMIGIESVTTQDDAVIVSFYSDQPPLNNVGAGTEISILNAIAQSLIDNLDDYSKVIYRVEGNAYISGHIELLINEVYLGDN